MTVKNRSYENIEKALEIAKMKFGMDNFEIFNARAEDLELIKQASIKSNTQVKIVQEDTKIVIEHADSRINPSKPRR